MIRDQFEDAVCVKESVGVPEAKNLIAVFGENRGSTRVVLDCVVFGMLAAIEFNNEIGFATGEVSDEGADWLLADKPEAEESAIAQAGPELAFGVGGIGTEGFGRPRGELGFENAHRNAP
jgi:hypothetical protein